MTTDEIEVGATYAGKGKSSTLRTVTHISVWWNAKPHYEVEYVGRSGRIITVPIHAFARWAVSRFS